ncbi:MAG: peptidase T [Acidobacteriota bacterium]|nr:peptidase T [Acidobacteriota bacterium]
MSSAVRLPRLLCACRVCCAPAVSVRVALQPLRGQAAFIVSATPAATGISYQRRPRPALTPSIGRGPGSAFIGGVPAQFTSAVAEAVAADLLDRFTRYVRIDTQSRVDRERSPSTPGQLDLSRLLVEELQALGLGDAALDAHGYVYATVPPTVADKPVVGLIAHVDTSPDAPGAGVEPLVHRHYDGGAIELPRGGTRLDPATMPQLAQLVGHDLVSSSGDTLLGADDKAGVAAIMAAVAYLVAHPELPRPTLRIAFTPDEEIGHGATLFDLPAFGARCAYTVDGSRLGELQDESFNAVEVRVHVAGVGVHPGFASGKLVSALRLAAEIVAALPTDRLTPETTSGRQGYVHPHFLHGVTDRAELRFIVRDFDEELLQSHVTLLRETCERVAAAHPRAQLDFEVIRQYRNMRPYIERDPEVVAAAEEAFAAEGVEPIRLPIRGGTDGSRLSEMGLPTPNIFDGGYEYHSVREFASLQHMAAAAAVLVRLAEAWTRR